MEKEFVLYEQALALKELGFDEPCIKEFHIQELLTNSTGEEITNNELIELYGEQDVISAPLYQQVFRWVREKYGIKTYIYEILENRFVYIRYTNQLDYKMSSTYHETYEEAEFACLKKLIEIVKNK